MDLVIPTKESTSIKVFANGRYIATKSCTDDKVILSFSFHLNYLSKGDRTKNFSPSNNIRNSYPKNINQKEKKEKKEEKKRVAEREK